MIAQPNRHYEYEKLRQLLDERLPREEARQVESHLSHCETCQHELEQIAGQRQWWDETVEVLSESTIGSSKTNLPSNDGVIPLRSLDASLDWIRPLLDDSATGGIGQIDRYPVQGVIGQGGMGVVLRGIDPELNRPVAIKILSPHLAGVGAARARFMREAQAAAAIVHPSIVPIYSVVTSARLPYIVMPCINGGNLQQRLNREGPLDLVEVLRIGLQIAEGLAAAHRHGVIHRDIKPANILIEEGNGRVLISDFGLARALDDATLTISGMIAGTPQYMSPEQSRGDATDTRSDLFSLGSLLYALATGRAPFRAETPYAVLRKISETRPRPVYQINERMPAWFDALVGQFMRIDVDRRIASADDAVALLRDAHAHVRNPSIHGLPKSLATNVWIRSSRLLRIGIVVGAIPLVAMIALGFFAGSSTTSKPIGAGVQIQPTPTEADTVMRLSHDDEGGTAWRDVEAETELNRIQFQINSLAIQLASDEEAQLNAETRSMPIQPETLEQESKND